MTLKIDITLIQIFTEFFKVYIIIYNRVVQNRLKGLSASETIHIQQYAVNRFKYFFSLYTPFDNLRKMLALDFLYLYFVFEL